MCRRNHCEVAIDDWQRKDTENRNEQKLAEWFYDLEKKIQKKTT